ncbi:MAG: methyl-accepting chemotaxis protein, partial [Nitrospinota bacterium]|nr:methyl-accepting chemotaxis protein [Nitrospinota bacterium]
MFKTIQVKVLSMLFLVFAVAMVMAFQLVVGANAERAEAERMEVINEISGHLNSAAAFQAIERGVGATILGSDNPSGALLEKFKGLGAQGDEQVRLALEHFDELFAISDEKDLKSRYNQWQATYKRLIDSRHRVTSKSISDAEWIKVTSTNIAAEILARNISFAPVNHKELVRYYNTVTRANVATLAEYAGRERAILGGHVAAGTPVGKDRMETLSRYRALVDQATEVILSIKGLESTPSEVNDSITVFERVFLESYQRIRERVYQSSAEGKPYHLSGGQWIDEATKGINSALEISNVLGGIARENVLEVQSNANRSMIVSGVLLSVAFGVFAFSIFYVRSFVTRPLRFVVQRLQDISEGEGDLTRRIEAHSEDELGELAFWFNNFVEKIQSMVMEISGNSKALASSSEEMATVSNHLASGSEEMN